MIGTAEFWASILRPIPSRTPVTPTLAVLKLVTPLSLVLAGIGPQNLSEKFFWLGVGPVVAVLLQVLYLTIFKIEVLDSEPHKQAMAKLANRFGQNVGNGPRDAIVDVAMLSGNVASAQASPAIEAPKELGQ